MRSDKSILHVVNIYFVLPYFLGDQLIYFNKKGYKEHIICSSSKEIKSYASSHKFKYLEVPIVRKISLKEDWSAIRKIRKYIKDNKIDIVVGHTPKGALLSMIASKLERVPKRIYFRHGLVFETAKGLRKKILIAIEWFTALLSTQVVNVSPSIEKRIIEKKLNNPSKQVILGKGTCNGISTSKFNAREIEEKRKEELRTTLNISNDAFVIGYTGRLVKDKGIVELIKAFEILKQKYPKVQLLLVGMFEERDALPMNIAELIKNHPDIKYTGYVDYENIEYYYSLMQVFVLPSYREGFPTSVLEASSMELPVITTKATGCVDSIIDGTTGLFITHKPDDISTAIEVFIEDENKRKTFGLRGREFVKENFDSPIIWKEIETLYKL